MFKKEVNYADRREMIKFLENHFRYWTMNSWNRQRSYANCVKLYKLDLPEDIRDKAWSYVCGSIESDDIDWMIHDHIASFKEETGYDAGFNGRSDGYIVLYDTEWRSGKLVTIYRGLDEATDFDDEDEWGMTDLEERVKLLQRFDEMCDNIREDLIDILKNSEVEEYEVVTTSTHKRFVSKEE